MPERRARISGLTGLLMIVIPFIGFVVAEIAVLILAAENLGWWTLAILLASSAVGVFLLQREWRKAWAGLSESIKVGALPPGRAADALLVLLGGMLLIMPGFITDVVGLFFLLPFTRPMVRSAIGWWAGRAMDRPAAAPNRSQVIKGEVVEGDVVATDDVPRIENPDQ